MNINFREIYDKKINDIIRNFANYSIDNATYSIDLDESEKAGEAMACLESFMLRDNLSPNQEIITIGYVYGKDNKPERLKMSISYPTKVTLTKKILENSKEIELLEKAIPRLTSLAASRITSYKID